MEELVLNESSFPESLPPDAFQRKHVMVAQNIRSVLWRAGFQLLSRPEAHDSVIKHSSREPHSDMLAGPGRSLVSIGL